MMVDDDRLVLATIAGGLEDAGYELSTAESAENAEAILAGGARPDLAILDVRMPGNGGLHLAQRLRALDHIPFIMLSAYSDPEIVKQATQCGALGFAVKPLDIVQLIPTIEAALVRAAELRALRSTGQQLQQALDAERDINVAVGITMMEFRIKRGAAFALLRASARTQRCKLAEMAEAVVKARETLSFGEHQLPLR
jgi:AmiR/NasT family two-component response regulator